MLHYILDYNYIFIYKANMVEVILNENEQKIVEYIAKKRYKSAREKGFVNMKISNESNEEIDLRGFGAEFAFCKWENAYPSFITGKTDKADCIASDGTRVDIKATDRINGNLLVSITKKINDVDVYFLVVKISNEKFNIVGYEDSKNVICKDAYDRHQNDSRFKGEGYVVYQEDLFEIKEEKIY